MMEGGGASSDEDELTHCAESSKGELSALGMKGSEQHDLGMPKGFRTLESAASCGASSV